MSKPASGWGGVLETQTETLLASVEQDRERRRQRLLDEADKRAEELLRQARRTARSALRRSSLQERQRIKLNRSRVRATIETRQRHARHERARQFLRAGLQALDKALTAAWQDPEQRQAWCREMVARAARLLPKGQWEVRHPESLTRGETVALAALVEEACGHQPLLLASTDLSSGLCIRIGTANMDGSMEGLLADRAFVEAAMLAELDSYLGATIPSGETHG